MNPCYSGFQVQGTATSPTGMAPSDTPKKVFLFMTNRKNTDKLRHNRIIITDEIKNCK